MQDDRIRVLKKDYESNAAIQRGVQHGWYHLQCFLHLRRQLEFLESGDKLRGFKNLQMEDKEYVKKMLPKVDKGEDDLPIMRIKREPSDNDDAKRRRRQNDTFWNFRDKLSTLKTSELDMLMERNKQSLPKSSSNSSIKLALQSGTKITKLDLLSDAMAFGALNACGTIHRESTCNGQLLYESGLGYRCINVRNWRRCNEILEVPRRSKFLVPDVLKGKHTFLAEYEPKIERRKIKFTVQEKRQPLNRMEFCILGETLKTERELKGEVSLLGGEIVPEIHKNLAACISNLSVTQAEERDERLQQLKEFGIQIVLEDFIDKVRRSNVEVVKLITDKNICPWGGDASLRIMKTVNRSKCRHIDQSEDSLCPKIVHVKGGGVDPRSGLEDKSVVYMDSHNVKYTVTLGGIDVQSNRNNYYKLQILKSMENNSYWLFRGWGRIGENIGNMKLENYLNLESCINDFEKCYIEKTGNQWGKKNFVKFPNKRFPIGIDYEDDMRHKLPESKIACKLSKRVQGLMKLIFNTDMMRQVILELKIDLTVMPLGKLAKNQIHKGYEVLKELEELITNSEPDRSKFIDATNKFYTFIPHAFRESFPDTLLDTREKLGSKLEMLESLRNLTFNYELLNAKTGECTNPLDYYYEQLEVDIRDLCKDSKEFKLIEYYVKNSHGKNHNCYKLELEEIFAVKRHGEDEHYEKFKTLSNRMLLWHGTRTTNYASIFSNGLNAAPPGVPLTGSMFGCGIYFADRVSKSVWYCRTSRENPIGFLLLCEVALGNMDECYRAKNDEILSKGSHSRAAWGKIKPDPSQECRVDGVCVPLGRDVPSNRPEKCVLQYNEYIVYDRAQVRIKYLVKVKKIDIPKSEFSVAVVDSGSAL